MEENNDISSFLNSLSALSRKGKRTLQSLDHDEIVHYFLDSQFLKILPSHWINFAYRCKVSPSAIEEIDNTKSSAKEKLTMLLLKLQSSSEDTSLERLIEITAKTLGTPLLCIHFEKENSFFSFDKNTTIEELLKFINLLIVTKKQTSVVYDVLVREAGMLLSFANMVLYSAFN